MISAELLVTLLQLKTYALEQKSKLLRGGRGLPETDIPDEPEMEDFISGESFAAPEEAPLALPDKQSSSIAELIEEIKHRDINQIHIDEAVAKAAANEPAKLNTEPAVEPRDKEIKPSLSERLRAYYTARTAWHVEKYRIEDKDRRSKRDVLDKCYGYDDMIAFINKLIRNEQERNAAIVRPEDAEL